MKPSFVFYLHHILMAVPAASVVSVSCSVPHRFEINLTAACAWLCAHTNTHIHTHKHTLTQTNKHTHANEKERQRGGEREINNKRFTIIK